MIRVKELVDRFGSEEKGMLLSAADLPKIGSGKVELAPVWDFIGSEGKPLMDTEADDSYWN